MNFIGPCLKKFPAWMGNLTTVRFGELAVPYRYAAQTLTFFHGQVDNIGEEAKAQNVKQRPWILSDAWNFKMFVGKAN